MQSQISPSTANAPAIPAPCILATPRPELAGRIVRIRGEAPIYLIDPEGYRRLIPFPVTFLNLFEDKALLQEQVSSACADIAEGSALDEGAVLLRGRSCEYIYLLDHGQKRRISGLHTMQKYQFSEEAVLVIPKILIDAIPEGEIWE
jgi:hypothetical protein